MMLRGRRGHRSHRSEWYGGFTFPVLIDIVDPALRGGTGTDLLFTGGDGQTKLAHQVDRFDGATGALTAWVRVPMLAPDAVSTKLFLYRGNAAASPQESPAEVWIGGYAAVFHLQETPGAGAGQHAERTARTPRDERRRSGGRQDRRESDVDGVDNRLDTASFAVGSTFTYEAWVQPVVSTNRWRCIVNNDPLYNRWFAPGHRCRLTTARADHRQ
jgi:hypothetical protein